MGGVVGGALGGTGGSVAPGAGTVAGGVEGAEVGATLGGVAGAAVGDWLSNLYNSKGSEDSEDEDSEESKPYAKPKDCPAGTIPIDQIPWLKGKVHDIKKGVYAGPEDWTGIAPNGDVITGDHEGNAVNNGNYKDFLPGSGGGH